MIDHSVAIARIEANLSDLASAVAAINAKLDKRVGFAAGVAFTVSALVASIAGAFAYFRN